MTVFSVLVEPDKPTRVCLIIRAALTEPVRIKATHASHRDVPADFLMENKQQSTLFLLNKSVPNEISFAGTASLTLKWRSQCYLLDMLKPTISFIKSSRFIKTRKEVLWRTMQAFEV